MKKFVGIAAMALAMTSLAACSNKTAQPKSSTTQSSQTAKKTANIVGTYQDGKKAAILFKKDGTGRYVSNEEKIDAEFNWKKKNKSTFTITINDRKENHTFTAKLTNNKLKLKDDDKSETFKRVKGRKLNLDDFLVKEKTTNNQVTANTTQKSNIAGDEGLFDIPADMQGTWYSADHFYDKNNTQLNTITIGQHTISYKIDDQSETTTIHKMAKDFDFTNLKYLRDDQYVTTTRHWGRSYIADIDGDRVLNVRSWLQGAGDGDYYYLKSENGQTVLVTAHGAGVWADAVYWRDEASARKYANRVFDNIRYDDDIKNNMSDDNSDDE